MRPIPNRHTEARSIVSICPRVMASNNCSAIANGGSVSPASCKFRPRLRMKNMASGFIGLRLGDRLSTGYHTSSPIQQPSAARLARGRESIPKVTILDRRRPRLEAALPAVRLGATLQELVSHVSGMPVLWLSLRTRAGLLFGLD